MSKKVQTFHDYMQSIINASSPKKINKRGKMAKGDYQTGLFGGGKSPAQQAAEQAAAQRAAQRAAEQAQRQADAQANQRAAQARAAQQNTPASNSGNGAAQAAQNRATAPVAPVAPVNSGNGAAAAAQNGNTRDAGDIARDRRRAAEAAARAKAIAQAQAAARANGSAQAAQSQATAPVYQQNSGNGAAQAAQLGATTDPAARLRAAAQRALNQRANTSLGARGNAQGGSGIGQFINDSVSNVLRNFATTAHAQDGDTKNPQTQTAEASQTAQSQTQTAQAGITPPAVIGTPTAVPTETTVKPEPTAPVQGTATYTPVITTTPTPYGTQPTIVNSDVSGLRSQLLAGVTQNGGIPEMAKDPNGQYMKNVTKIINDFLYDKDGNLKWWADSGGIKNYPNPEYLASVDPEKADPLTTGDSYNPITFSPSYPIPESKEIANTVLDYLNIGSGKDNTRLNNLVLDPEVIKQLQYLAEGKPLRGLTENAWKAIQEAIGKNISSQTIPIAERSLAQTVVAGANKFPGYSNDGNPNPWGMPIDVNNPDTASYSLGAMANADRHLINQTRLDRTARALATKMKPVPTPDANAQATAWAHVTPLAEELPARDNPVATAAAAATQTAAAGGGGGGGNKNDQPRSGGGSGNTTIIGNGPATAASAPYTRAGVAPDANGFYPVPPEDVGMPWEGYRKTGSHGKGTKNDPMQIYPDQPPISDFVRDDWAKNEGFYARNPKVTVVSNVGTPTRTPYNPAMGTGLTGPARLQQTAQASETANSLRETAQATESGIFRASMTPTATQTPAPTSTSTPITPTLTPTIQGWQPIPTVDLTNPRNNPNTRQVWPSGGAGLTLNPGYFPNTSRPAGQSSQIITTTPTQSRTVSPTQTQTQTATATPTQSASLNVDNEIAQILNNQRTMQQQAASAFPQFASTGPTKQARMSSRKKAGKLKKDIGVGTGLTAHATQPVPESPMPKIRTTYGSYKFKKPQQQRSAKYGEDQQLNQPIRKQINPVQPRQTMQNVMQFPPSDAFQPFAKMIGNPMDKYEKNDLTKSLQQTSKFNNAYSNEKYKK